MADFTITFDGVPHRVRGANSREQAEAFLNYQMSDPFRQKQLQKQRRSQLKEMGIELENKPGTSGGVERFFVGAGRSIDALSRGAKQLGYMAMGEDEKVRGLERQEQQHRELFDLLDSEGIGMEDIGQLAPDILAFAGTGGGTLLAKGAQLAGRGALLAGSYATTEGESHAINAALGSAFALGGGAAAGAVGSLFALGSKGLAGSAKFSRGVIDQVAKWSKGGNPDDVVRGMAEAMRTAQHMANASDKAVVELGEASLKSLSDLVGAMNSAGKESVYRQYMRTLMNDSIVEKGGRNVLDTNKWLRSLEGVDRRGLVQALGKTFGQRMDDLRTVFRETQRLGDMPQEQASQLLRGIMVDDQAASIARALAQQTAAGAKEGTITNLRNALTSRLTQLSKFNPSYGEGGLREVLTTTAQRAPAAAAAGGAPVDAEKAKRIGDARGAGETMQEVFKGLTVNGQSLPLFSWNEDPNAQESPVEY